MGRTAWNPLVTNNLKVCWCDGGGRGGYGGHEGGVFTLKSASVMEEAGEGMVVMKGVVDPDMK